MKGVITIFILPYEIDDLHRVLHQLKRSSFYLSDNIDWTVDVTMTIGSEMVDWSESILPKSFFEERLFELESEVDWCSVNFRSSSEINGCISQRRFALNTYNEADFFIWLDTDIIFDTRTLGYFQNSVQSIHSMYDNYIITPEIVRIWDHTWDCLVNDKFLDKQVNYHLEHDPYEDSGIHGDVKLETVHNNIPNQPRFKFAGGWFTVISGNLLRTIRLPESFGHYGADDTFIMYGSEKLISRGEEVVQFKLKNVVVCEDYKYRNHKSYTNHLKTFDRRDEYRKRANSNFNSELNNI